jgi:hypothetical protein
MGGDNPARDGAEASLKVGAGMEAEMTTAILEEIGYRWARPSWERAADNTWIFIVPSRYTKDEESEGTSDPYFDRSQRFYEVFEFDGTWVDQLHELQVERMLRNPRWRAERNAAWN